MPHDDPVSRDDGRLDFIGDRLLFVSGASDFARHSKVYGPRPSAESRAVVVVHSESSKWFGVASEAVPPRGSYELLAGS